MKNKTMLAVISILLMTTILFGCTPKTTSDDTDALTAEKTTQYITQAQEKLDAASGFAADFYTELQMGAEDSATISKAKVEILRDPLTVGITVQDLFGQSAYDSQIFLEKVNDGVNMYMLYDGQWTEMTLAEGNAMKSIGMYDAVNEMSLLLASGENWQQSSVKNGVVTLTGEIPAQKIYDVSEAGYFLQLAGMNGVDKSYYANLEAIPVIVQVKEDGTPVSFSADFSKTLETVMNHVLEELGQESESAISVEKFKISQTISNLNEIKKITIPPGAKDAINYEKEISLIESSAAKE